MSLRVNHQSGGPACWLQGIGYTPVFSGVTALSVAFSYRVMTPAGPSDQFNVVGMLVNNLFDFYHLNQALITKCSGAGGGGVSSALADGLWHMVGMTVQAGGLLKTFVDGDVVDEKPFSAAATLSDPNGLLWLGANYAQDGDLYTADFSIDQLNGWAGVELTEEEMSSLAQGLTHPEDYGVAAQRFRFDFNQDAPGVVNGPSAGARDKGLYDLDQTTQGFWMTHGEAEWEADRYLYTNPCRLLAPVVQESGYQLEFTAVDGGGKPMLLSWKGPAMPLVEKAGSPSFYLSTDGLPSGRPLYAIDGKDGLAPSWKLPWQVLPGEVVTVHVPPGVFLGANLAPNVETLIQAVNNVGVHRQNFEGKVRPDHPRIGVVGSGQSYYINEFYYTNLIKNWDRWLEVGGNGWETFLFDSSGNIIGLKGSTGTGLPYIRGGWGGGLMGGVYTLLYTAGDPFLTGRGGSSEGGAGIVLLDSGTCGGISRKRYMLTEAVEVELHCRQIPTGSIELLDPFGVDASGYASVGMIHPRWKAKYDKGQCNAFRHLVAVNNDSGGFGYRSPDGWYGPWPGFVVESELNSLTPVPASDIPPAFTGNSASCFHVSSPGHSFVDGQLLACFGTGGPPPEGSDGTSNWPIVVDSPDSFYVNWSVPAAPGAPTPDYVAKVVGQYNPDLTDPLSCVSGMAAFDRVLEQCNLCDHDYWFTYPVTWSDQEIAKHEAYVAARLKPGLHNYREWGNETHWNIGSTVFQFAWTRGLQNGFTGNVAALYAGQRGAEACLAGLNAWVAAGRSAREFSRVLSGQAVDPGTTFAVCWAQAKTWWASKGYPGEPFDVVTYAPYGGYELTPGVISGNQRLADWYLGGPAGPINPGGVLDVLEATIEGPIVAGNMRKYRDFFASTGLRTAFYEWGVDFALNEQTVESGMPVESYPGGNATILRALVAAQQHPRHNRTLVRIMNLAAEVGCELACHLGSVGFPSKYGTSLQYWSMYQALGDGTKNLGHLFDTPPPEANSAYALREIALTPR